MPKWKTKLHSEEALRERISYRSNQVKVFSSGTGILKALSIMLNNNLKLFQCTAIYKLGV